MEAMKDTKEDDNTKEVEDEPNTLEANGENIEDKEVEQEDVEGLRNADGLYLFNIIFLFQKKYTIEQNVALVCEQILCSLTIMMISCLRTTKCPEICSMNRLWKR